MTPFLPRSTIYPDPDTLVTDRFDNVRGRIMAGDRYYFGRVKGSERRGAGIET